MSPRWMGCVPADTRQPPQSQEVQFRYSGSSCSSIAGAEKNRRHCVIARETPFAHFPEPALDPVALVVAQAIHAAMLRFDLFQGSATASTNSACASSGSAAARSIRLSNAFAFVMVGILSHHPTHSNPRLVGGWFDQPRKLATATDMPGGSNTISPSVITATVTVPSACLR